MPKFQMHAREFKSMKDPNRKAGGHTKYVCYIDTAALPQELSAWTKTILAQKCAANAALCIYP